MLSILGSALLYRPPLVQDPSTLRYLDITRTTAEPPSSSTSSTTSYPIYRDLSRGVVALTSVVAFHDMELSLHRGASARKVAAQIVSPGFFDALGVLVARGRGFLADEGDPRQPVQVAVIGWRFWQRELGGAHDVLGRELIVADRPYIIVGVLPRGFHGIGLETIDLWLPMSVTGPLLGWEDWYKSVGSSFLHVLGRLAPNSEEGDCGEDSAEAQASLSMQNRAGAPAESGTRFQVRLREVSQPWGPARSRELRVSFWLGAMSLLVLGIAGFNAAGLLAVRQVHRLSELATHVAVGARPWQLTLQSLLEGVYVGGAGALEGLLFHFTAGRLFRTFLLPVDLLGESLLNPRWLTLLGVFSLLVGLLAGLPAAFLVHRQASSASIGANRRSSTRRWQRAKGAFLTVQVAFTLVLLVGAGLFNESLAKVRGLARGVDLDRVLLVSIAPPSGLSTDLSIDSLFRQALGNIAALEGVEATALGTSIPFVTSFATAVEAPGSPGPSYSSAYVHGVSRDFATTLGAVLRKGRGFIGPSIGESAPAVLVNETLARKLWPHGDPVGQCLAIAGVAASCTPVIGVLEDVSRQSLFEESTEQIYLPLDQAPEFLTQRALFVRTSGRASSHLAGRIRDQLLALNPRLPLITIEPLGERVAPQMRPWQMATVFFRLFAVLAWLQAALGLFGTVAHSLAQRMQELAVRIALGAHRSQLLLRITRLGLTACVLGIALGSALLWILQPYLEPLLYGVTTVDARALGGAIGALFGGALLAIGLAAIRALRLHPASLLKT